jgi:hypothetical protein
MLVSALRGQIDIHATSKSPVAARKKLRLDYLPRRKSDVLRKLKW